MLERFTAYQIQVFATTVVEGNGSEIVMVTTDEDGKHYPLTLMSHLLYIVCSAS